MMLLRFHSPRPAQAQSRVREILLLDREEEASVSHCEEAFVSREREKFQGGQSQSSIATFCHIFPWESIQPAFQSMIIIGLLLLFSWTNQKLSLGFSRTGLGKSFCGSQLSCLGPHGEGASVGSHERIIHRRAEKNDRESWVPQRPSF